MSGAQLPIYLDYAATTPVDPRVAEVMMQYLGPDGVFGNPASRSHSYGWQAEEAVEGARTAVAELLNADVREIVWTSGATESDNLAIKGAARFYGAERGRHIVTSAIEHKAVLDSCRQLESEGFEVTYIKPNGSDGMITPELVEAALRDDTCLVSLMHVNNELGTITDIAAIGELTRGRKILFHVDAAQSASRLPIDTQQVQADFISLSGHKMYGPKGVGALYVRRRPRARLQALIHGGGHERGMRSGTLATHQIAGMGEAARLVMQQREADAEHARRLMNRLTGQFEDLEQVFINGSREHSVPGIVNISFAFIEGESLMMSINGIALSSGSACTSASLEPSYVLRALGVEDELAHSSLRFSVGRFTTEEQVDYTAAQVRHAVEKLRQLSPLWDMYKAGIDLKSVQWVEH
ncbi:MAG: IscS subfamily cysteine desulfurase [Gammaproteobacteria bacterium AqS3]|nr:IscS subfamily cysteine desulfurase [Gammaproteobacteria bacterium AqS3]